MQGEASLNMKVSSVPVTTPQGPVNFWVGRPASILQIIDHVACCIVDRLPMSHPCLHPSRQLPAAPTSRVSALARTAKVWSLQTSLLRMPVHWPHHALQPAVARSHSDMRDKRASKPDGDDTKRDGIERLTSPKRLMQTCESVPMLCVRQLFLTPKELRFPSLLA